MKKVSKVLALAMASFIALSACSKPTEKKDSKSKVENKVEKKEAGVQDNLVITNDGTAVEDATLKIAYVADAPFTGIFHQAFADGNPDIEILEFVYGSTFKLDSDYKITKGGPAEVEFMPKENKVKITLNEKYSWNDGTPVTSDDFLQYYKIIADKDYDGVRYDEEMRNLVGLEEYHDGTTSDISGFKKIDDKHFELTFKQFIPGILWGSGIPTAPVPSHVYKDIPVKEQSAHDMTRKTPLSCGPYYIKEIIPGQQAVFEANPHYWNGEPKVKNVVWKIVPSTQVIAALESGEYDLTVNLNSDLYEKVNALKNIQVAVKDELAYTYIGFKLGKWNSETGEVETNPNAKMADVRLRQAMGYALDNDQVGEKFYQGLRKNATQLMIPVFKDFYDETLEGYVHDEEKAKKLLDEAGYKDVDGDGIREDKEGKPFVIKFASMSGGATAEPIAAYYVQQWGKIGLKVEYTTGRLIEFNSFYDKVEADDEDIDVYQAAWGTGTNPNPTAFYGKKAAFNFPRFTTPELDKIFDKINSVEAVDDNFRANAYKEFAKYMFENAPVIPTLFRKSIVAVNNRVKKYDITPGSDFLRSDIELTAKEPIK